jgi:hypothetical protein
MPGKVHVDHLSVSGSYKEKSISIRILKISDFALKLT